VFPQGLLKETLRNYAGKLVTYQRTQGPFQETLRRQKYISVGKIKGGVMLALEACGQWPLRLPFECLRVTHRSTFVINKLYAFTGFTESDPIFIIHRVRLILILNSLFLPL